MSNVSRRMHIRQHGQTQGPFEESEVRRRYEAGEIGAGVVSWCAGESRWQSLERRWSIKHRNSRQWPSVIAGLLLIGLAVVIAVPSWSFRLLPLVAQQPRVLWMLECTLIGLALIIIATGGWRIRRRAQSFGLTFVLGSMVIVLAAVIGVSLAKLSASLLAYRLLQDNALVSFNEKSHDIVIKGAIGPHLTNDLESAIKAHPDALKILIRSQGGLVNDAFRAADVITAAHLPLEVVNYCASACVLLWAVVPQREMAPGSRLGLHQSRLAFEFDHAFNQAVEEKLEVRSVAALDRAGFSPHLQWERRSTPPEKIFWVSAKEAKSEGVAFNLVEVPLPNALF